MHINGRLHQYRFYQYGSLLALPSAVRGNTLAFYAFYYTAFLFQKKRFVRRLSTDFPETFA